MRFKNLLKLKDGTYRLGYDVTEDDYGDRPINIWGAQTYKALNIGNNVTTEIKLQKHLKTIGLDSQAVSIKDVNHDVYSGYIYFTTEPHEDYIARIKEKYNLN